MDPITIGLLGGAGLGALKGATIDRDRENRQRKLQAEIARYSPWSGMQANPGAIPQADILGSAMQGGMGGAMLGQGVGGAMAGKAAATGSAGALGASGGQSGYMNLNSQDPNSFIAWQNMMNFGK